MVTGPVTSTAAETPLSVEIEGSYIDWSTIIAGAVAALAVSFVLLSFGAAVGLSAVSPWTTSSSTVIALGLGSAFWILLVNVWAFALGGYLAARLRHPSAKATQTEMEFRDAAHGLLTWATAIVIAGMIGGMIAASSSARDTGDALSGRSAITAAYVDKLLRAPEAAPAPREVRSEVGRLMATAVGNTPLATPDRQYLTDLVAARSRIDKSAAEQRVTAAITDYKNAMDRARKAGIVLGFFDGCRVDDRRRNGLDCCRDRRQSPRDGDALVRTVASLASGRVPHRAPFILIARKELDHA